MAPPAGSDAPADGAAAPWPAAADGPGTVTPAALQPAGTGPAGAGCGPYSVGALPLTLASHAVPNAVAPTPSAAWNASSSVRPSAYDRMSFTSASLPYVRTM